MGLLQIFYAITLEAHLCLKLHLSKGSSIYNSLLWLTKLQDKNLGKLYFVSIFEKVTIEIVRTKTMFLSSLPWLYLKT